MIPTDRAYKYAEDEISTLSDAACVTVAVTTSEKGRVYTVSPPGFGPMVRFTIPPSVVATDKKSALLERVRAMWEETMRLVWENVRKMVPPKAHPEHEQKTARTPPVEGEEPTGRGPNVGITIRPKFPSLIAHGKKAD